MWALVGGYELGLDLRTTEIFYEWLKHWLSPKCSQNENIGLKRYVGYPLKKPVVLSWIQTFHW
jgi:hypothetical protein